MSIPYLAQADRQQKLEWLDGGTFSVLLDSAATGGQLTVGRFDVSEGEAPPFHMHTREDEVFMLIGGTALLWVGDEEMELSEGGIVYLPRNVPHGYRVTRHRRPAHDRHAGRHRGHVPAGTPRPRHPRPPGFEISREALAAAADAYGQVVVGPPR